MKRGVREQRIALAIASVIAIMTIFGAVLILSGRSVETVGEVIVLNPYTGETSVMQENPCSLLRCTGWKQPFLLGYEEPVKGDAYAVCVCAIVRYGEAHYNEIEIKKIRLTRQY